MTLCKILFLSVAVLVAIVSSVSCSNIDCVRGDLDQCSPNFNGSNCCRCRGDSLFMLDIGLKTGRVILNESPVPVETECRSPESVILYISQYFPVIYKVAQFVTIARDYVEEHTVSGDDSRQLYVTTAVKTVIDSVENKTCQWINALFPCNDQLTCGQLLEQIKIQSFIQQSIDHTHTLKQSIRSHPQCKYASLWNAVWSESAICRETAEELDLSTKFSAEYSNFESCSN